MHSSSLEEEMDHMILIMEEGDMMVIMVWVTKWDSMVSKCMDMEVTMESTMEDIRVSSLISRQ